MKTCNEKKVKGCLKCGKAYPDTSEFFHANSRVGKDGIKRWYLRGDCRACRNRRGIERTISQQHYVRAARVVKKTMDTLYGRSDGQE